MKKILNSIGIRAFSGTYVQNGFMIGFSYGLFDEEENEDRHLSIWLGLIVLTIHIN